VPNRMTTAPSSTTALFDDSTPLLTDSGALRERVEADGFLFFRGLLPRDGVMEVRRQLLAVMKRFGWLVAGQDDDGGEVDLDAINSVPEEEMRLDIGVSEAAYKEAQKIEMVHRFPHHPNLLALYRRLFEGEVLVHPRHIIRMVTGHRAMVPTPPHQDFPLIQGTPRTWTCWIPLGDCPAELGGLAILRGSHRNGCLPIQFSKGAGGIATRLCPSETDWVRGDYSAGDVITFPSYTVHKALPCKWKSQVRLSLDVRYQAASEVVEEKSLLPHCDLPWEEIYSRWERDDCKYYWRKHSPVLSPWDETLRQPGRRIC
jgi:hypothetical protein